MKNSNENIHSFSGKGLFPARYAFTLLLPFRNLILSPKKLVKQIKPHEESIVLEVGPGPGFFSAIVARAIPKGKLVLFDIQESMLNIARKRLKKKRITNVDFVTSDGGNFPFNDNQFDIIFMVTVLGEVQNKTLYFQEFRRVLKQEGIVAVSEQKGDPDLISIEDLKKLFFTHGFTLTEKFGSKLYYTLIFKPI